MSQPRKACCHPPCDCRAAVAIAIAALAIEARGVLAQVRPTSNLGIAGVAAIGLHTGTANVERKARGREYGGIIDIGWIRVPRLRIQGEVDFLRANHTERVEVEDSTYSNVFYDLTTSISALLLVGGERWRLAPYLSAGVGVHALSSAFHSPTIDRRYNVNPFGFHIGAGARIWLGGAGRGGVFAEARYVVADNVNRTSIRAGALVFFRDLIRP